MTQTSLAITMGDPSGIGPEVICKAILKERRLKKQRLFIIGWLPAFELVPEFKKIKKYSNIEWVELDGPKNISSPLKLSARQCGGSCCCCFK